jgi:hypothetical protein
VQDKQESVKDMIVSLMMDRMKFDAEKEQKYNDPEDEDELPDLEDDPKPPPERKLKRPDGDDGDDNDDGDEEESSEPELSDGDASRSKGAKRASKGKKKKIMFALDPESLYRGRVLDFTRKSHKAIYTTTTKSLYADNTDRYDLDAANTQNFLQRVQDQCLDSSLGILDIPQGYKELEKLGKVPDSQIYFLNICESHRYLTQQEVKAYVTSFVDTHSRVFQED